MGVQFGPDNNQGVLDRTIRASTAKCPSLNLTVCQLESFRRQRSAGDGVCSEDSFVVVVATKFPGASDYPVELWVNSNWKGKSYEVRVSITSLLSLCRSLRSLVLTLVVDVVKVGIWHQGGTWHRKCARCP
jgi:hypothetical protein